MKKVQAKLLIVSGLFLLSAVFGQAHAVLEYTKNELRIIFTPDYMPIVWWESQTYGVDFSVDSSELPTLTTCNASNPCPQAALDDGAVYQKVFTVEGVGNVTVYYDAEGNIVGTAIDRQSDSDGDGVVDENDPYPTDPVRSSNQVGEVSGQFDVDPSGAANYTVPIAVPPGTAGMQPSLALSYSSMGGNGPLGVGWSIDGLSAVHRCGRTIVNDGFNIGITYTADDNYCLDGQRLIPISGQNGAEGTEYRTEIDSFSKIISHNDGTSGSGPTWFEVWTKSGQIIQYGYTSDSRVEAVGKSDVRQWSVSKISDTVSNYIDFFYTENTTTGEHYIDRVEYGGNGGAATPHYAKVQFVYENRTDTIDEVLAGSALSTKKRLQKVVTYVDPVSGTETTVKEYRLAYSNSGQGGSSKIKNIQECDGAGSCLPITQFGWELGSGNLEAGPVSQWADFSGSGFKQLYTFKSSAGDFNGDGKSDAIFSKTDGSEKIYVALSNGTSLGAASEWLNQYSGMSSIGDYDGDGKDDLLRISLIGTNPIQVDKIILHKSNGVSFGQGIEWFDLAGQQFLSPILSGDVNGDGKDDLVGITGSSVFVFLSNGSSFSSPQLWAQNLTRGALADVNGDGRSDFIHTVNHNAYGFDHVEVRLSTGTSFQAGQYSNGPLGSKDLRVGDVDGDGRSDLIYIDPEGDVTVAISEGDGFSGHQLWRSGGLNDVWTTFGDYDGDGLGDLLNVPDVSAIVAGVINVYLGNSSTTDIVTTITSGNDKSTSIAYKLITDSTVYTPDTNNQYGFPVRDLSTGRMQLVSSVTTGDGIGSTRSVNYTYGGARVHLEGRGMLGFRWTEQHDVLTDTVKRSEYHQDFPFTGMPTLENTKVIGVKISETINPTAAFQDLMTHNGTVHFPYVNESTQTSYDFTSTNMVTEVKTESVYDTHGNATDIKVTTTDGIDTFVQDTDNVYINDETKWHLGRLTSATVTYIRGAESDSRNSTFAYDPVTGLITQEVIEPNSTKALTTAYTYDSFGNKETKTLSGPDIVTRTTTSYYDSRGRFPETITNAVGLTETREHDERFGGATKLTGPNGLATDWHYDSYGRKYQEDRSDGTQTAWSYSWCDGNCVTNGSYILVESATASATVTTQFDELGRKLLTSTQGFNGQTIYNETTYNAKGQIHKFTEPYFYGELKYWNEYVYDSIGRVWKEIAPGNRQTTRIYDGLSVSISDARNKVTVRTKDAMGRLAKVVDADNFTTTYAYDVFGNLEKITDPAGNETLIAYDNRGKKQSMDDPDMGHWEYNYNSLGELVWQKDAKNQVVDLTYDKLGRLKTRTESEGVTTWNYYDQTATAGSRGKLESVTSPHGYMRSYTYDNLGRGQDVVTSIDGQSFTHSTAYDIYSRPETITYPSGFAVKQVYNNYSHLKEVRNASNDALYWQADNVDARGNITKETLGNNVITDRIYYADTGYVKNIYTGSVVSSYAQSLEYVFDEVGNLTSRTDHSQSAPGSSNSLQETFTYDNLNRVDDATITGIGVVDINYDEVGNITSKSDVGSYAYSGVNAGPHAVTSAGSNTYSYDDNGNMVSGAGRTIGYTSFNKPSSISNGTVSLSFIYGADRARIKQTRTESGVQTTTYYLGSYEKVVKTSVTTERHYIIAGGKRVAIFTDRTNGISDTRYLHTDHLGSTDAITDENGQVVERFSFDAFGRARKTDWTHDPVGNLLSNVTTRGFTGHEHLDGVGLIHMNGRVYDPTLGRFLSADPNIQAAANPQNLNRYSYVLNNPLSYTDPSGFFFKKLFKKLRRAIKKVVRAVKKYIKPILAMAVAVAAPYLGINPWTAGFASGFVGSGGNLKMGLVGALSAGMFDGLHDMAQGWQKVFSHGMAGGVSSELGGGDFKSGFLAAGFTQFASWKGGFDRLGSDITKTSVRVKNAITAAIVGGTAAVLGGGKFSNGAWSAAFSRLFNDIKVSRYYESVPGDPVLDANGNPLTTYQTKEGEWFNPSDAEFGDAIDGMVKILKLKGNLMFPLRNVQLRRIDVVATKYYQEIKIPVVFEYNADVAYSAKIIGRLRNDSFSTGKFINEKTTVRSYYEMRPVSVLGPGSSHYAWEIK